MVQIAPVGFVHDHLNDGADIANHWPPQNQPMG